MVTLYGKEYAIDDLKQLTSTMDQFAGVRFSEYTDGRSRGMRTAEVWTGSGFRFSVYLDRAMDIGPAEYQGKPLAWLHPGLGTPANFEPQGFGFLKTFGGGLVTLCGMTHFGRPEQEGIEVFGLHGRISHIAAENVHVIKEWAGDTYILSLVGEVRQATLFGENFLLRRTISTSLAAKSLVIEDCVRNEGYRAFSHMMLYHCNFGFPVVSPSSVLMIDDEDVQPRAEIARSGLADYARFGEPVKGYKEQVFFHTPKVAADGFVTVRLYNRDLDFGIYVRYRAAELPAFTQWKNIGAGEYLCGLEPCTNHENSRDNLREQGKLKMLEPGEEIHYRVEIGVMEPAK